MSNCFVGYSRVVFLGKPVGYSEIFSGVQEGTPGLYGKKVEYESTQLCGHFFFKDIPFIMNVFSFLFNRGTRLHPVFFTELIRRHPVSW